MAIALIGRAPCPRGTGRNLFFNAPASPVAIFTSPLPDGPGNQDSAYN